jgi:hypothetical protein
MRELPDAMVITKQKAWQNEKLPEEEINTPFQDIRS